MTHPVSDENKIGIWLHGQQFSSCDCAMVSYFIRLYQLGLQWTWENGERPHIAMYIRQAFHRPSVLKATKWKDYENQYFVIDKELDEVKHARFACYSAMAVGASYLLFRALRK